MNKKDLIALGVTDEQAEQIVVLHGKDIEAHKTKLTGAETQIATLQSQLQEAGTTIESFKAMKPDELKLAADEWKAKAEKAQTEAAAQVTALKFDHAIESSLKDAKAKNITAVRALLKADELKMGEDGSIVGLDKQLEKVRSENDYLFEEVTPTPKFSKGGNPKSIISEPVVDAMRKAAGLGGSGEKQ